MLTSGGIQLKLQKINFFIRFMNNLCIIIEHILTGKTKLFTIG